MKYLIIFFSLLTCHVSEGQINTTWKYHKLIVKAQSDSLSFFNVDSLHNMYSLEKIRITFKDNNIYEALYFNGEKKEGIWKIENQKLIVDADTNMIITQTSSYLRTEGDVNSMDLGYNISGKIITELIKVPDCSNPESLKSGDWNDPATWSCDRVPNKDDNVIIHTGHTVTLLSEMGSHNCKNITVETGAVFMENGRIYLYGN